MIKRAIFLVLLIALPLFSNEVSFDKKLSDLDLQLQNLTASGHYPSNYRDYLSLYAQKHSEFISIRKLWISVLLDLPSNLSGVEKQKVSEFSNNKLLQQLSLDEVAYFAYVYEDWATGEECKMRIAPLVNAINSVYSTHSLPFGITSRSAMLLAYYLSYPPPKEGRSIHACFKASKISEGVVFLKVPPLSTTLDTGKTQTFPFEKQLPPGKYKNEESDITSKIGGGHHVYDFCYDSVLDLEGKCFSDFGRQCSARRD